MATLKQNASVNGQVISNTDPDMVIKLDDHPVVQIQSIQDNSITYKFLTEVAEMATYTLNLTFTYKLDYKLTIPLTFTHNVLAPTLEVTAVKDFNAFLGWNGDIKLVDLIVKYNGKEIPANSEGIVYTSSNTSSITIEQSQPEGVNVKLVNTVEKRTPINSTIEVSYKDLTASVPILITHIPIIEANIPESYYEQETGDVFVFPLVITERGVVVPLDTPGVDISYFPDNIISGQTVVAGGIETKVVKTNKEESDNNIIVRVGYGGQDFNLLLYLKILTPLFRVSRITENKDLVGGETNLIQFKLIGRDNSPLVGLIPTDFGAGSFPDSTAVLAGYSNVITEPTPGTYQCSVDLGHVKGRILITVVFKDAEGVLYIVPEMIYTTPGTPIIAEITPWELYANDEGALLASISITQKRYGVEGETTFPTKLSTPVIKGPVLLIDGFPTDFNVGRVPVKVKGNGTLGEATITFDVSDDVDGLLGNGTVTITALANQAPLTLSGTPASITGKTDDLVIVPATIKMGDVVIPLNHPSHTFTVTPESVAKLMEVGTDSVTVKMMNIPKVESFTQAFTLEVSNGRQTTSTLVQTFTKTNKTKPIAEVTGEIIGVLNDQGSFPIKITGPDGTDLTDKIYDTVISGDAVDFIIPTDGEKGWVIVLNPAQTTSGTANVTLFVNNDGVAWRYPLRIPFTITVPPPLPTSLKFNSNSFNLNTLSSGGVNMTLWDDKGVVVTNAEFVSVTNDISDSTAFMNVGTNLEVVNQSQGRYRYPITSTHIPGRANFTFTFKIGTKTYVLNSVPIINYGTAIQTVTNPKTIPKAVDASVEIVMFAQQQRTIDSQVYTRLKGNLNTETGVSGINESTMVRAPGTDTVADTWAYTVTPDETVGGFTMNAILTEENTGKSLPLKFTLNKV